MLSRQRPRDGGPSNQTVEETAMTWIRGRLNEVGSQTSDSRDGRAKKQLPPIEASVLFASPFRPLDECIYSGSSYEA